MTTFASAIRLVAFVCWFLFLFIMARFSASDFRSSVKSILGLGSVLPFAVTLDCECIDPEYVGRFFDIVSVARKKNGQIVLIDAIGNQFTPEEMLPADLQVILDVIQDADMNRIYPYI